MSASVIGALIAAAVLVFVGWPLFAPPQQAQRRSRGDRPAGDPALSALREVEFDFATGKLSPADHAALQAVYTARALAELRARGARCAQCGADRPAPDALFCSACGAPLAGDTG